MSVIVEINWHEWLWVNNPTSVPGSEFHETDLGTNFQQGSLVFLPAEELAAAYNTARYGHFIRQFDILGMGAELSEITSIASDLALNQVALDAVSAIASASLGTALKIAGVSGGSPIDFTAQILAVADVLETMSEGEKKVAIISGYAQIATSAINAIFSISTELDNNDGGPPILSESEALDAWHLFQGAVAAYRLAIIALDEYQNDLAGTGWDFAINLTSDLLFQGAMTTAQVGGYSQFFIELMGSMNTLIAGTDLVSLATLVENMGDSELGGLSVELQTLSEIDFISHTQATDQSQPVNNYLQGSSESEIIESFAGNDRIVARGGDDILNGGTGDDVLDGGDGQDTAVFSGDLSNFLFHITSAGNLQTEDTIREVEFLQFDDQTISIETAIATADTLEGNAAYYGGFLLNSLTGGAGSDHITLDYSGTFNGLTATDLNFSRLHQDFTGNSLYDEVINLSDGTSTRIELHYFETYDITATNGDDSVSTEEGNDIIHGLGGGDDLRGKGGNDELFGGDGDDTLRGGTGTNKLYGGTGNDLLLSTSHLDILSGGAGFDRAHFDLTQSTLGQNYDVTTSSTNWESIEAVSGTLGGGDDTVVVTFQLQNLTGGAGSDHITLDYSGTFNGLTATDLNFSRLHQDFTGNSLYDEVINLSDGTSTRIELHYFETYDITATNGDDSVSTEEGNDIIHGLGGGDDLRGKGGNDELFGGDGDDTLRGGTGNDILNGGIGNDQLNGETGTDTADYSGTGSGVRVFLSNTNEQNTLDAGRDTLTNIENLTGSAFDDSLYGDAGDNALVGGNGADRLVAGSGNDILRGGNGNDILKGRDGDDALFGGNGNDILYADTGLDTLDGGADNDSLYGGRDNDVLNGGGGIDRLRGNLGLDILNGNLGADTLFGGGQNDTLNGGAGNDFLLGENGNDILQGNLGDDKAFGGNGIDTFVFDAGDEILRIRDWNINGDQDKIDLTDFGFASSTAVLATATQAGVNVKFTLGSGDFIFVENTTLLDMEADDFLI